MLISQILKERKSSFSCELFPPKEEKDIEAARLVAEKTAMLGPDFISVTYGASGSTSKNTLQLAKYISQQGATALAHLTCVSATREEIREHLKELRAQGIENILALRGDEPVETGSSASSCGHYLHASELVREIKEFGGFCVGAACYPEGHPEAPSSESDLIHLKEKADAGCDFLITQMFFDNDLFYRFLYRMHDKGIELPVLAGVMPVINRANIRRIVALCGASLPPRFQRILDRFGDKPEAMRQAGIAYATEQIIDLIANGVDGIHLYTMNKPEIAREILENVNCILRNG